jgi:uncharacterized protein with ParB-like and HNH nuclease domain
MNIEPHNETIRSILKSGKQFNIPRFQREYSWERRNHTEFLNDIISGLIISEGKLKSTQYFLGTMLFIGDLKSGETNFIDVVDGQQRLTTITILFSAISDVLLSMGEDTLSEQLFSYIMTKDDDGNEVRIVRSKTHYPYFSYAIQKRLDKEIEEPKTPEEASIKETFEYFLAELQEEKLRSKIKLQISGEALDSVSYTELLQRVRDQVLDSLVVSISTTERKYANQIFEILNAKGMSLSFIDLVKNKIFENVTSVEPVDIAEDLWGKVKENLYSRDEIINIGIFFRHFWVSKYKHSSTKVIYDDFQKIMQGKSEGDYIQFLKELVTNSDYYVKFSYPRLVDYDNKIEYNWLVQSLNSFNNVFNITQVRVVLLALFALRDKGILSMKTFKRVVLYLEDFHFSYNVILQNLPNKFEKIYSTFATSVNKAITKSDVNEALEKKLLTPLSTLVPKELEFREKFEELTYVKNRKSSNVKTKYVLRKIHCSKNKTEIFPVESSVEHIIPEGENDTLNIGNLILLEQSLNSKADSLEYNDKIMIYKESKYKEILQFVDDNKTWATEKIMNRTEMLSGYYYNTFIAPLKSV